jgi:SAM-dependent methyltransferase
MMRPPASSNDTYARFARFYDLEYASYDADLAMYRDFARQANGPVLELGCGTGRVLRALLDTRLPLTGVDASEAMLDIARQTLGPSVRLFQAAMERLGEAAELRDGEFWLAFSAINTFLHLPDMDAQLAMLRALRRSVTTGGLLLLDLMLPEPGYLAGLDGRLSLEFTATLPGGDRLDKWVSRTHDLAAQAIDTTVLFDVCAARDGSMTRTVDTYRTRYIHRFEIEHLLARAGWTVISVYGSYDLEPYSSDAERMVVLATRELGADDVEG